MVSRGEEESNFRSPQSDIEVVPSARKRLSNNDSSDTLASKLNPLSVTKENMSTNSRPDDSDFTQQRLFGWQPILTPYNVLPVLFILGLIFVPIGIVFLTASLGIAEYSNDYTNCDKLDGYCTITLNIGKDMEGPVAVYYRLTNFYQNNRLYAMSKSDAQLKGEAVTDELLLKDCAPLDKDKDGKIIYPCGLIANSYFSDEFGDFVRSDDSVKYAISPENIAWPGDSELYGKTKYELGDVVAPPDWVAAQIMGAKADGTYTEIPNLEKDERFQNWMKISGLPTFRKLYGRINGPLKKGEYTVKIKNNYDVSSYKGTKSIVISTTNWAGGKNDGLGLGFIIVGGLLLLLGLVFLVMFMMAPRKVGDVSYLSWYAENAGDPLIEIEENMEQISNH